MKQKNISELLNIGQSHVSQLKNGNKRMQYKMAKILSKTPIQSKDTKYKKIEFWMEATPEQINTGFAKLKSKRVIK